jgi:uncharacterized protein YegP (UPF0339 family)
MKLDSTLKWEIHRTEPRWYNLRKARQYWFRSVFSNGRIGVRSELYHNLNDCEQALRIHRDQGEDAQVIRMWED